MEISGSVIPRVLISSIDGGWRKFRVRVPTRAPVACGGDRGLFSDDAHLKYYGGTKEKEEKKRAKLIKGLMKDLSELSSIGFGTETDQSNKISEMAEQLLEQLNQLKTQEKEMKKKKKEEKAACMKKECEDSSSSSSSESSESDCEESKILQLSDLKAPQNNCSPIVPVRTELPGKPQITISSSDSRKIEVCLGGKCKKNGSVELLCEIENKVGIEGAAVGCKCMGRCKEGPNVCVSHHGTSHGTSSVEEKSRLLCIGVGLDDVDTIVSKFFEGDKDDAESESQLMVA